jgi:putative transcriptional regulator
LNIKEINTILVKPQKGSLLLSEPFLLDEHFRRTVILLTEHNEDGTIGFIMNRLLASTTDELVPGLFNLNLPVYYGGPVEGNTLHLLLKSNIPIVNAFQIKDDLWWGGDIHTINLMLDKQQINENEIRLFLGYSGWSTQQLENEIKEKAWWATDIRKTSLLFKHKPDNMWAEIVKTFGKDFAHLANPPEDPFLN